MTTEQADQIIALFSIANFLGHVCAAALSMIMGLMLHQILVTAKNERHMW